MLGASKELGPIEPTSLYPISVFLRVSGLNRQRIGEARRAGVELPTINVGRRKFVEGAPGIDYIKRLAALSTK